MGNVKELTESQQDTLLSILEKRFATNMHRHKQLAWAQVQAKLYGKGHLLWPLQQMEATRGEPDVIGLDAQTGEFIFCDCAAESPAGRRSLCYDKQAWQSRKDNRPLDNVMDVAAAMGIQLLNEMEYRALQHLEVVDTKTSSWLHTPAAIRTLGGAIFGDYRYGQVFVYHNGAQSYYAARGFRGLLRV